MQKFKSKVKVFSPKLGCLQLFKSHADSVRVTHFSPDFKLKILFLPLKFHHK